MYNLHVIKFYVNKYYKGHTHITFKYVTYIQHCHHHCNPSVSSILTCLFPIQAFSSSSFLPLPLHHGFILLLSSYSLPHHLCLYPLFIGKSVVFFYSITISCITLGILFLLVIFRCPCHFSLDLSILFYCQSVVSQMEQNAHEVPCSTMFLKQPLKTFSKHVLFL